MQAIRRPGSEVKTVRQVVKGLESEGIHISDTLVKAVREERELSPPVEPTPLFKPEVIEVVPVKEDLRISVSDFSTDHNPVNREVTSTEVQQFTFPLTNQTVRIVDINGVPHWIAKDVCEVLDLDDVSKAVQRLDDDEKLTRILFVSGQKRDLWLVTESGLYSLVFTSRKPEAKAFKKWVTSEVLPSIRKTGGYGQQKAVDPFDPEQLLIHYANKQIELSANVKQLETKNVELVAEVTELSDHIDALGLGTVCDSLFSP